MNPTDQLTADDIILDLLIEGVEPTHQNLVAAIAAHPQHRDALVEFFASLAVQSALEDDLQVDGCGMERFANIGVSHALELHHRRQSNVGERQAPPVATVRLSNILRERGITELALAARTGLDEGLVMKLDLRRISSPRPMELFRRLGDALDVPPAHVVSAATGPPISSSRGNLRKAKGRVQVLTETFEQAINGSNLPDETKAYWLRLLADEAEPKA